MPQDDQLGVTKNSTNTIPTALSHNQHNPENSSSSSIFFPNQIHPYSIKPIKAQNKITINCSYNTGYPNTNRAAHLKEVTSLRHGNLNS